MFIYNRSRDPEEIVKYLKSKKGDPTSSHFIAILQSLLLIPENELGYFFIHKLEVMDREKVWEELDKMVRKLVMLQEGDDFNGNYQQLRDLIYVEGVKMALPDLREVLYQKKQFEQYVTRLKELEHSIKNANGNCKFRWFSYSKIGDTFEVLVKHKESEIEGKFQAEKEALQQVLEEEKKKLAESYEQRLSGIFLNFQSTFSRYWSKI